MFYKNYNVNSQFLKLFPWLGSFCKLLSFYGQNVLGKLIFPMFVSFNCKFLNVLKL